MVSGPKSGSGATVRAFRDDALAQGTVVPLPDACPRRPRLVGCGAPVGSLSVAIVAPGTGERAASDRVGEVWVAGESIGKGYWRNPGRTAATFHAQLRDPDDGPFLRTGDLGFMHDRELYITGRIDDLIIVRGLNHHPQDIEATARQSHPLLALGLGAAFAVEDNGAQRLVLVHEVVRDGSADLARVIDAVRIAVLEGHGLALDAVVLIRCGTIAKTSSGKVQRRATCAAFRADELKPLARHDVTSGPTSSVPAPSPAPPAESAALAAICQHALSMSGTGLADVAPETPIEALGLDSLQRMELVAALEKSFGRHLPDTIYSQAKTLGDLAAAVQRHLFDHPHSGVSAGLVPAENYDVAPIPRIPGVEAPQTHAAGRHRNEPLFQRGPGRRSPDGCRAGARAHRRPRADQFLRLRLRRDGARPGSHRGRQGRDRPLRHRRWREPPRLRRKADPSRPRARARRVHRHACGDRLRLRPRDQRHDDRAPDGPGRPHRPRHPRPQLDSPGRAALRRDLPRIRPQRLARARRAALGHSPQLPPRADRHRGCLQHGRRLPRPRALRRHQGETPRDALRRRGPLARHDGHDRPRPRRTRRHRRFRRRRVDGHAVQVAGELRRVHRRLRRTRRVPQVHGARVRLQRGHVPAQRGHRAGRTGGAAAANRSASRGSMRCRASSSGSPASADSIRGSPPEPR